MVIFIITFIVYLASAVYLNYDIKKYEECSLWDFLIKSGDLFSATNKIFPLLIIVISLPILALWAFTDNRKDKNALQNK